MKKMSAAIFVLFLFALLAGCAGAPPTPMPPLHIASENGDIKAMKELLDGGAKINETVSGYWTPLNLAARNCRLEAVKLLLDRGAEIKDQDNSGSTALHAAASYGCDKVVKLLIDRGADINARYVSKIYVGGKFYGEECYTPLHIAANRGHSSTVRLLIENGADTYEAIVCFNNDKKLRVRWGTSDTAERVKEDDAAIQLIEMAAKSVKETRTQVAVNKVMGCSHTFCSKESKMKMSSRRMVPSRWMIC